MRGMGPILALFTFTMRQTLVNRRIWLTVLLLSAPCALILVIRGVAPPVERVKELWEMYHVSSHFLLISLLVPLVCMVHGTALIGAEVEARTIAYLTTRRMRRGTLMLVKFAGTALVLAVLCDLALVAFHLCGLAGRDLTSLAPWSAVPDWQPTRDLGHYLLVIPVEVVSFLAIFNFVALIFARPLAISAFYLITMELVISNIPAKVAKYSLLYHLRMLIGAEMPRVLRLQELPPDLHEKMYPQGVSMLPQLLGIILVALVLSGLLVTFRELVPTKVARD
jgi:hypothetical protein